MPNQYRQIPVADRFWPKVDKTESCWIWTASRHGNNGYGGFQYKGVATAAHRVSWILAHGSIPEGMHVLHNCPGGDNPLCVRPDHLWLGTHLQNMQDRDSKGRGVTGNHVPPEHRRRGDQHPLRIDPSRAPRTFGDRNGSRLYPERLMRGEQNARAKATALTVQEMRALYAGGSTPTQLSERFGLARSTILEIVKRKTWRHVD